MDERRNEHVHEISSSDATSEEEFEEIDFELPPGFTELEGSDAIPYDTILSSDKELWLFKLPKELNASDLSNVSIQTDQKMLGQCAGTFDNKGATYDIQIEAAEISNQIVNAFPSRDNRKKFKLGKPFSRFYSVVYAAEASSSESHSKMHKRKKQKTKAP